MSKQLWNYLRSRVQVVTSDGEVITGFVTDFIDEIDNDEQDEIIFPMMEPKEVRSKPFYSDAKRSKIVCEKTPNTGFDSLVAASYPFAA